MQPKKRRSPFRRIKRALKKASRSAFFMSLVSWLVYGGLRLVARTQRLVSGSSDWSAILASQHPSIVGLWHGQHLLAPLFRPRHLPFVALLSRSADAEVNARVVSHFGIGTVRGSGGREQKAGQKKGGARALIALRHALAQKTSVVMIADVPKATAREAGLGIVTLAKISGRPVIPSAAATSRRHVVSSAWDKTSIPLPFGRMAVVMGEPIYVPGDADGDVMEQKRQEITVAIEAANRRALELVDAVHE